MKKTKVINVDLEPIARQDEPRTVRVALPVWLLSAFEAAVKNEYGARGHSRWVDEAVINLIRYPEWVHLLLGKSDVSSGKTKTFTLSPRGSRALDDAIREVRKNDPLFEGVISEVLRTAIAQRLLRSGYDVGDSSKRKG